MQQKKTQTLKNAPCVEFAKRSAKHLEKSAIILTSDSSSKFGEDKGLLQLDNKSLLNHVVDAVKSIAEEIIIVTSSKDRAKLYAKEVSSKVQITIDDNESNWPLVLALTGFKFLKANTRYFCRMIPRLFQKISFPFFMSAVLANQLLFHDGQTIKLNHYTQFTTQNKH